MQKNRHCRWEGVVSVVTSTSVCGVVHSTAVFRLRASHKCVCAELQAEEELEAHLAMVLQEHE